MLDQNHIGGPLQAREWQQFLDGTVHDLRAGLRAARISAELLGSVPGDPPATERSMVSLLGGLEKIETLSLALGRYSRSLYYDGREIASVSLSAAVKAAADEMRALIKQTKAEVRYGELPTVRGSYAGFVALFRELLTNALTYRSTAPPLIEITVSSETDHWQLAVTDNGIGIEQKFWEKVFVPFQRLQRDPYGPGLGLAICKNVAEQHGGRIWLRSEVGIGTTVFCFVPKSD